MSRNLLWVAIAVACNTLAAISSWAAPVRDVSGDLWADRILGQPDFSQINFNETTANALFDAYCVVMDNAPGHNMMYVYDCGNNRVLGVTLVNGQAVNGQGATLVLGQPDFNHSACNGDSNWQNYPSPPVPNASCLCGNSYTSGTPAESGSSGNMAVDAQGNLYVPDYYNNRVLRYDWPISSGQSASHVWGQVDFTGAQANQGGGPTSMTLAFILPSHIGGGMWANLYLAAVGTDDWGNLWVADAENNRVLRFPNQGGVPGPGADVVLGQNNFTSSSPYATGPTDLTHMRKPTGVRLDGQGNVYVTDLPVGSTGYGCVGRILVYQPTGSSGGIPTYTNGQAAVTEFGQAYLTRPVGLEIDPTVAAPLVGLWVTDSNQIIEFLVNLTPTITATAYKSLLKQSPQASNTGCGDSATGDIPPGYFLDNYGQSTSNWNTCDLQGSLGVDSSGNIYLGGKNIQDVWRFPAPIPTPRTGYAHSADIRIFKPAQNGLFNTRGTKGMYYAIGLAIGEAQGVTQVIAADRCRLMYWNIPASGPAGLTNGQAADGIAAPSNTTYPLLQAWPELWRIAADRASPQAHLWALRGNGNIQIHVFNLPLTGGEQAAVTLYSPLSVLGGGSLSWGNMEGMVPDATGNYLWLSDKDHNRVFRVRNPLGSPVVDIVLGQTTIGGTSCNQPSGSASAYNFCAPGALAMDHQGNLYVSDHSLEVSGNRRLLRFNSADIQNSSSTTPLFGVAASAVYGTNGQYNTTGCYSSSGVCGPWQPAFNSDDSIMVAGMNTYTGSHFPLVLRNPLLGDQVIATLEDYSPQAYCSAFDDSDNLYVADLTRSRVMIYLQPYTPVATFTPTATPTGTWYTPTATITPTITPSFTPTNTVEATPGPCNSFWHLNGNASAGSSAVTVTPNLGSQVGSAWNSVPIDLNSDFDMTFKVFLGSNANGSDGMGFVIQSQGIHAMGTAGGGLGFGAVSAGASIVPSVDIELDTHQNTELGDPSSNHISLEENGQLSNILAGPVQASATSASIKDGLEHTFEVVWDATSHTLTVYFDSSQRLTFTQDIVNTVFGGNPTVYWGFTGGTGGDYNLQYFKPFECPPTATPTYTPSVTSTSPPTASPTCTPTPTDSTTPTTTVTNTMTVSMTPTMTLTVTGTVTGTVTLTGTPTVTHTATVTPSSTNSATYTATSTVTNTMTVSASSTPAPSNVPSDTPTDTPTISPTPSGSPADSVTPTVTNQATVTPSLTVTPTATLSATPSSTSTETPSFTWSPSNTPTVTTTVTNTMTFSATFSQTYSSTPTRTPTPTASMTFTGTPTSTSTITFTPTPQKTPGISLLYSNPVREDDTVSFDYSVEGPSEIKWAVYTVAFRKIYEETRRVTSNGTVIWNLTDRWGKPAANGLYYIRVEISGSQPGKNILKLIILR